MANVRLKGEPDMAVQLSPSYLRRSFQLLAKLKPTDITEEEAFSQASNIIYTWAKHKFWNVFRNLPPNKTTLDEKWDGNEIGILYNPDEESFIFRCAHPDVNIAGRRWIVDAELKKHAGSYVFAVRLSVTSLQTCKEDIPFSCPDFVSRIIRNIGLSDVIPITDQPRPLSTREEVDDFIAFLENPERNLPVLLLTPCFRPEDAVYSGYMLDAAKMAKNLMGVAHVFQIASEVNGYLTEKIGKQWSAFNGAVRTYYPQLSFEESNCYQHPMLTQNSIRLRNEDENGNPELCMQEIEGYIKTYIQKRRFAWEDCGIEFYFTAYQNYMHQQKAVSIKTQQELIDYYEKQIDQLQKQAEENLSLADSYAKDNELLQNDLDEQRQKNNQLKAMIAYLRSLQSETEEDQDVPTDCEYTEVENWIGTYYPDRLVLLPRAKRSLKDAVYEDKALVFKCLKLLATKYYEYRTGSLTYDKFLEACKKVDPGLEERGAITDISAGMHGDEYYVQYRGQRHKLERHLAKGSSKDRRYCLRIYFFWDDEDQVVVIGDLPHHLDTSAT